MTCEVCQAPSTVRISDLTETDPVFGVIVDEDELDRAFGGASGPVAPRKYGFSSTWDIGKPHFFCDEHKRAPARTPRFKNPQEAEEWSKAELTKILEGKLKEATDQPGGARHFRLGDGATIPALEYAARVRQALLGAMTQEQIFQLAAAQ